MDEVNMGRDTMLDISLVFGTKRYCPNVVLMALYYVFWEKSGASFFP